VVGEGVVRVRSQRAERVYDKENYIDFRMRLLGEPGKRFACASEQPDVTESLFLNRGWTVALVARHPQLPLQARPAAGTALHVPGQARLGAVLLQGRAQGARGPRPQEPAGLHRHEPDRSEPRTTDFGGKWRTEVGANNEELSQRRTGKVSPHLASASNTFPNEKRPLGSGPMISQFDGLLTYHAKNPIKSRWPTCGGPLSGRTLKWICLEGGALGRAVRATRRVLGNTWLVSRTLSHCAPNYRVRSSLDRGPISLSEVLSSLEVPMKSSRSDASPRSNSTTARKFMAPPTECRPP
jgi:hypothetical protein